VKKIIVALAVVTCVSAYGQRAVTFDIVGPGDTRIPVAVPPFVVEEGLQQVGREMRDALAYDLMFTGLFVVLADQQYPPGFRSLPVAADQIDLTPWRSTPAESLTHVKVYRDGNKIVAECRMLDVASGQQAVGKVINGPENAYRQIVHEFADQITLAASGVEGSATSRIVFSGRTGQDKEIYIADYDGHNMRQVTRHNNTSIKPKFSPDNRHIAYVSFKDRGQFLYVLDLETGTSRPLSKSAGMNSAPAWSPDGDQLAMAMSRDGNPEIYLINADGSGQQRVTANAAVDTSPTFSPDGSQIAFVSERAVPPQVFIMNKDGANVRRISFQGGGAYDPVWSPDGKHVAYVGQPSGEGFQIFITDPANPSDYKRLTTAGRVNESPSWSPDSRHVVFTSNRRGKPELWTVTIETGEERPVPNIAIPAEGPSWGPRR